MYSHCGYWRYAYWFIDGDLDRAMLRGNRREYTRSIQVSQTTRGAEQSIQNRGGSMSLIRKCSRCRTRGLASSRTDSYCRGCRKVVNAKRSSPEARKARSDAYYWQHTVPNIRARMDKKYPYKGKRPGVFTPVPLYGPDNAEFNGIAFSRNIGIDENNEELNYFNRNRTF